MIPNWCLIASLITIAAILVFFLFPGQLSLTMLAGLSGCFFGAVLRDFGVARRLVVMWPVLRDVFDWQKVESKLH